MTAGILIGIGYIMSHFIWNICWTANRNLIPFIGTEQSERSWLSARIAMGSNLGKLAGSYLIPPITYGLEETPSRWVHRTTLLYRLKKIEEISGIDFNDSEKNLHHQLSIRLLKLLD